MSLSHVLAGIFIVAMVFLALELIMGLLHSTLANYSADLIKIFSKDWNSTSFATFTQDYNHYGFYIYNILWTFYVLSSGPKIGQILWVNSLGLGVTVSSLLNCFYHELRPSWISVPVTILGTNKDYANPSFFIVLTGCVTLGALVLYFFQNTEFCLNDIEKESLEKHRKSLIYSQISRILVVLLAVTAYAFLIFSEIYIETSTVGDAMHGFLLSLISVSAFFLFLRSTFIEYYKIALTKTMPLNNSFICLSSISLVCIAAIYTTYGAFRALDIKVDSAIVEQVKKRISGFTESTPLSASLINAGLSFAAIGANLGVLLSLQVAGINPIRVTLNTSFHTKILRLFFITFMILPLPLVMALYLPLSPVAVCVWFKSIIPSGLFGFGFFMLSDFLMGRLKLLPKIHTTEGEVNEDQKKLLIPMQEYNIKKENVVPLLI